MLIFAHRGLHNRAVSENTLPAFKRALEAGVDGVEFDLRVSRDKKPVVIHDENLDRVAGDARRVRDLTASELRNLELRGSGSIPLLNEVTSSIPNIIFDIEIKDREALEPLIRKLKTSSSLRKRTIVSSFVFDDLRVIRRALPEIRTLSLSRTWPLPFRRSKFWNRMTQLGVWGVGFPVNILSEKRLSAIRRNGFVAASWDLQPLRRQSQKVLHLAPDIAIVFRPK